MNSEILNLYIEKLHNHIGDSTKTNLLLAAQVSFMEKQIADRDQKIAESDRRIAELEQALDKAQTSPRKKVDN